MMAIFPSKCNPRRLHFMLHSYCRHNTVLFLVKTQDKTREFECFPPQNRYITHKSSIALLHPLIHIGECKIPPLCMLQCNCMMQSMQDKKGAK